MNQCWWARQDLNLRPKRYERPALTTELRARGVRPVYYILKAMKVPRFQITGSSVVNVVGGVVIVSLVISLGQTVMRNYALGQQINGLKQDIVTLQDQKETLAYNIQYYKTDSYREREARSKLGLQLPGENVVIIPRSSPEATPAPDDAKKTAAPRSNFQQWFDFLGGGS
jgi:cell division protein FtsB